MNLRKMWKRFWTLNVHNHEGFTLVELIIVIAILAILSSVAVVGYSAYVEKANKQADLLTIKQVEEALMLAYYSGIITESAYLKITTDGVTEEDGLEESLDYYSPVNKNNGYYNAMSAVVYTSGAGAAVQRTAKEMIQDALKATFGENYKDTLKLKYKWDESNAAAYVESNFSGNESVLLGEVEELTGALALAIKSGLNLGDFGATLGQYGLNKDSDSTAISNAAVLYVAEKTAKEADFVQSTLETNLNKLNNGQISLDGFVNDSFAQLSPKVGDAAALAAIYAVAEGFAQYCGAEAVEDFHEAADFTLEEGEVMDAPKALNELGNAFADLGSKHGGKLNEYMTNTGKNAKDDLAGYVGIMDTLKDNQSIVMNNLYAKDCFTDGTIQKMLQEFAAMGETIGRTGIGEIAISIIIVNGQAVTQVYHPDVK